MRMTDFFRPRIMIDMDHVLADFDKTYIAIKTIQPDLVYPQSVPGFFASLEPIENAISTYFWLHENFDTWILTRPSYMNPHCYTDKRLWVEKYLGLDICTKLILCPDKGLIKSDYLIDDMPWPGFSGTQLLFGKHGDYKNWPSVKTYFKNKYQI